MTRRLPPFPEGRPRHFRVTVHGTCFAGRDRHLDGMGPDEPLRLIPDPPGQDDPEVWVHLPSGDPIGHLPPEISRWLWPWLLQGGAVRARTLRVGDAETPSWRRVLVEVSCV